MREWLSAAGPAVQAAVVVPPTAGVALTEEQIKICKMLGQDPVEAAKDYARAQGAHVG